MKDDVEEVYGKGTFKSLMGKDIVKFFGLSETEEFAVDLDDSGKFGLEVNELIQMKRKNFVEA